MAVKAFEKGQLNRIPDLKRPPDVHIKQELGLVDKEHTSCWAGSEAMLSMLSHVRIRKKDKTERPPKERPVPPAESQVRIFYRTN